MDALKQEVSGYVGDAGVDRDDHLRPIRYWAHAM